jgi:hypothetical protein
MAMDQDAIESMRQEVQHLVQHAALTNQRLDRIEQENQLWKHTNAMLQAEIYVLRAFCSALAQTLPIERSQTLSAFSMFCATFRPDETVNQQGAEAFDVISQLISLALQAPPGTLPPVPPASPK